MTLSTQTLLYSTPRPRKRACILFLDCTDTCSPAIAGGAPPIPVIQRLPVNLWKDIMYLLLRDDTSALAACALVHSTWRVFVQALLFKHRPLWLGRPCPEKRNHQLEVPYRFLHSSCSNPVEPGESRISAFVSTFARNLRLAGHVVEVHYDLFLATRHLWLLRGPDIRGNLALDDFPDLPALLDPLVDAKLPNLSALRLTNLYRQGLCREYGNVLARSKYPYLTKMTGTDTALGRHFPALVRLELVDLLLGNLQTLENLLCSLPSLEHVLVSGLSFGTQDPLPDADSPRSVRLRTLVIRHVAHSSIDPIISLVEWLGKTPTAATLEHLELDGIVSEELVTPFAHFETEEPNHDLALTLRLERSTSPNMSPQALSLAASDEPCRLLADRFW
jgi:hypothetical protein